ncbi:MAG: DUF1850 domain-containing protein [Deltaproteobacteria bacterium]|nr:DUF1850 domain-containing protein [Deltaproteobacteria bacterium]MBW1955362.1 DUF1850 domain-containing protein [Deltaproteobacteria bacterium]MBW2042921.1 DUF1850 domain-containing protein [Deltaproteobacteria bacterium]MBW2132987.1 DUF1850 domain-containing protein [Deltaproteobacteria bacterium]
MKGPGRRILIGFAGLVSLLLAAAAGMPGGVELRLTPVEGREPLLALILDASERFTIRYYHSVENAPIWETHSVDENGVIYIEEERYLKFGAGMGKMPGVGRMVQRGPYEVIEGMHHPVGNFILRIGSPGVDHTLLWREKAVNLSKMAPHKAVRFTASPVNRLYRIYRTLCPHPGVKHLSAG